MLVQTLDSLLLTVSNTYVHSFFFYKFSGQLNNINIMFCINVTDFKKKILVVIFT